MKGSAPLTTTVTADSVVGSPSFTSHHRLLPKRDDGRNHRRRLWDWRPLQVFFRSVGAPLLDVVKYQEQPKTVFDRGLGMALLRCSVHLVPIGVTCGLAYLNYSGYFIGAAMVGGPSNQDRDFLLLQVAAKLMELLVVASLATVVLSVIRAQAVSKQGVALGLLSSPFRFNQISYFWSPAFLFGSTGKGPWVRRSLMALGLIVCGFIAIFAGPSSALLMVPSTYDRWPAGGSDFWLIGNDDTLWPERLNESHAGGPQCLNPNASDITSAPMYMAGCVWNGQSQLTAGLKDRHFDWQSNLTINDGVIKRQITRHQETAESGETWAVGPHVATGRISRLMADEWTIAVKNGSLARGSSSAAHFKNATSGLGIATVKTWIPVSRVICNRFDGINVTGPEDAPIQFIVLPEFAPEALVTDFWTTQYRYGQSRRIATHWVDVPPASPENHLAAALVVEIPYNQTSDSQDMVFFSCSIDARWTRGRNIGSGLPLTDNMVIFGSIEHRKPPYKEPTGLAADSVSSFLPVEGPDWRFAQLDRSWLNALLPVLEGNESTGWTSAAAMFTAAGFDNSTGLVSGTWHSLGATIESTIATLIVDGMSRVGLSDNGGNLVHVMDRYFWMDWLPLKFTNPPQYWDRLVRGQTVALPPAGYDAANLTKLHWSVTVSGLGFKASSAANHLALAVLITHAAIAACHTAYILCTRRTSDAWDCVEETLVLGLHSPPPKSDRLANTSAGIRRGSTFRCIARIIPQTNDRSGEDQHEQVAMTLDEEANVTEEENIAENTQYGRAPQSPWKKIVVDDNGEAAEAHGIAAQCPSEKAAAIGSGEAADSDTETSANEALDVSMEVDGRTAQTGSAAHATLHDDTTTTTTTTTTTSTGQRS